MNRREQARLDNAMRIAKRIAALLDEGYIVFDECGDRVCGQIVFYEEDGQQCWGIRDGNCVTVHFVGHSDFDMGMQHTVPEYTKQYLKWTAIHPNNIRSIF